MSRLKVKKITPMFTGIVTTANKYESNNLISGKIIDTKKLEGSIKEYQEVVAVGSSVRDVKVGDIVLINPSRYMIKDKLSKDSIREEFTEPTYSLRLPIIMLNDEEHLLLDVTDVAYIIEDYEEVPENTVNLIQPKKGKLILN